MSAPNRQLRSVVARSADDGLEELFRTRRAASVRLVTALTGDRGVAEEIVQDAFLEVSRRWEQLDNPAAYLRTALVNRSCSHNRRLGVGRRRVPPPPRLHVEAPELDELWGVLVRLPARRRAALVLRYYGVLYWQVTGRRQRGMLS